MEVRSKGTGPQKGLAHWLGRLVHTLHPEPPESIRSALFTASKHFRCLLPREYRDQNQSQGKTGTCMGMLGVLSLQMWGHRGAIILLTPSLNHPQDPQTLRGVLGKGEESENFPFPMGYFSN